MLFAEETLDEAFQYLRNAPCTWVKDVIVRLRFSDVCGAPQLRFHAKRLLRSCSCLGNRLFEVAGRRETLTEGVEGINDCPITWFRSCVEGQCFECP